MERKVLTPEEYVQRHKESFRCAFDFLNQHFPPGEEEEWFVQTAKDFGEASKACGNNMLVIGLLIGVFDYIEDEWKIRKEEKSEADN